MPRTPSRSTSPRAMAKCSARRTAARPGAKRRCRPACSTSTRWPAGENRAAFFRAALFFLVAEIRLDRAGKLDGQRIAIAVLALAGLDADPAFADAIFGDIGLLDPLEAHADVALEQRGIVIGAARVGRQAIGQGVGHDLSTHSLDQHAGGAQRHAIFLDLRTDDAL